MLLRDAIYPPPPAMPTIISLSKLSENILRIFFSLFQVVLSALVALASAQIPYPGFAGGPYNTAYLRSAAYAPAFAYSSYGTPASTAPLPAASATALDVFAPYAAAAPVAAPAYAFPYHAGYATGYVPGLNYGFGPAAVPVAAPAAAFAAAAPAPAPAAVAVEAAPAPVVKVMLNVIHADQRQQQ